MEAQPTVDLITQIEEEEAARPAWYKTIWRQYLVRRTGQMLLTIFLVSTIIFFLLRLLPGNPIEVFVYQKMTQEGASYDDAMNQARALFAIDVDQPLILQYFDYLKALARGDLGMSILSPGTSVVSVINSRIWWTIFSVGTALMLAFVGGSLIGMVMAYKRGSMFDGVASTIGSILNSIPNYLLALVFIIVFGVRLKWIPYTKMRGSLSSGQHVEMSWAFFSDALYHAILPISIYAVTSIGGWMLLMKSTTVATLEEDYVGAGRARGVPEWRIMTQYVGRNAILPLFTQLTIAIGFVTGGSLLVEPIFNYQGIGALLLTSINKRDYPVIQGVLLVVTISVVVALFVADLLYSRLDPRIRS